jgi:hypothetical protein
MLHHIMTIFVLCACIIGRSSNFTVTELLARSGGGTGGTTLEVLVMVQVANMDAHTARGAPSNAELLWVVPLLLFC